MFEVSIHVQILWLRATIVLSHKGSYTIIIMVYDHYNITIIKMLKLKGMSKYSHLQVVIKCHDFQHINLKFYKFLQLWKVPSLDQWNFQFMPAKLQTKFADLKQV